jgi:hypothetical protein
LGTGILYSAQSFAVQAAASNSDLPFAAAMYSFFRSLGQTFGVAVGGVIFQNTFKSRLSLIAQLGPKSDEWAKDASAMVQVVKELPSESIIKDDIVVAYVDSLKMVWVIMCGLASLALMLSLLFIKDISLDREHETEHGFKYKVNTLSKSDTYK